MAKNVKIFDLVVPKEPSKSWDIGQVIGLSDFDLSIGPVLKIKDIRTGFVLSELPGGVDVLVRRRD